MTADSERRLILVRHAKSAWPDVPDHERPLAPRGRRQAPLAGAWLRNAGYVPDLVLCSTARRARETWRLISDELGTSPQVTYEGQVYGADMASLLQLVQQAPETVSKLLIVGHDPGIRDLAVTLADEGSSGRAGDALERVGVKFPTGAVAVLAVPGAWPDLGAGAARLTDFVVPRELKK
ncbi:MAG: SixA phosphatase family protein [Micromonosporaceae bacterium]